MIIDARKCYIDQKFLTDAPASFGTKPVDFITIPIMMIRVNEKALISTENIKTSLSTPEAGFSHMKGNGSRSVPPENLLP